MKGIIDFLWRYADSDSLRFPATRLKDLPDSLCAELLGGKYLIPSAEQLRTIWDDDESHEIYDAVYADGKLHHFYSCGDQTIEVSDDEMRMFRVSFHPFADIVRAGLRCTGTAKEILPGKIWFLGAAGQQRREVYLVRKWTDGSCYRLLDGNEVKRGAIIIHIGKRPVQEKFDENQVFSLDTMVDFNGLGFRFDGQCVFEALKDMVAARPRYERKNSQPRQEQHQTKVESMLGAWFRMKYENAKRQRNGENPITPSMDVAFTNQKELAKAADVNESAITRMKETWKSDMLGGGWAYYLIIQLLGHRNTEFIDFYNEHKDQLKKIGIEY